MDGADVFAMFDVSGVARDLHTVTNGAAACTTAQSASDERDSETPHNNPVPLRRYLGSYARALAACVTVLTAPTPNTAAFYNKRR